MGAASETYTSDDLDDADLAALLHEFNLDRDDGVETPEHVPVLTAPAAERACACGRTRALSSAVGHASTGTGRAGRLRGALDVSQGRAARASAIANR